MICYWCRKPAHVKAYLSCRKRRYKATKFLCTICLRLYNPSKIQKYKLRVRIDRI